jgi:hypothetical protein
MDTDYYYRRINVYAARTQKLITKKLEECKNVKYQIFQRRANTTGDAQG